MVPLFRPQVEELEARYVLSSVDSLFVASAWQDLVGKPIPPAELARLSGRLDHGVSRPRVVREIEQTGAYRTHFVRELNQTLLGGALAADVVGEEKAFLAAGGTADQFEAALLASADYYRRAGGTAVRFLRAVYRDVLGKSPDRRGRERYVPPLASAAAGPTAELVRFDVAEELLHSAAGRAALVRRLYLRYLGQAGDSLSVRALVRALGRGLGQDGVAARLVGSGAYVARLLARLASPSTATTPLTGTPTGQPPSGGSQAAAPALVNEAVTTDPGVQQMPSVAVDPLDSSHVVIAYMDYSLLTTGYAGIGVAVSHDGGSTWQHTAVPLPAGFDQGAANPIAKFDGQGHVFVSFMAATFLDPTERPPLTNPTPANPDGSSDRVFGFHADNGVFVARSDDGGRNWGQPVAVVSHLYDGNPLHPVFFETTPDLAVDTFRNLPNGRPNPNYGNLYVAWSRLYPNGQFPGHPEIDGGIDILLAVSTDGGLSWQTRLQEQNGIAVTVVQDPLNTLGLPGLGIVDQPRLAIGPEGDIYESDYGAGDFTVHHSTNAGVSFDGPDHTTGYRIAFGTSENTNPNLSGLPSNNFRINVVRAIVADPTRPGYVYAADTRAVTDALGNLIDAADVIFARSTDYGVSWQTTFDIGSTPASVLNDDNGGQSATGQTADEVISGQAMPRMAVDSQGNIGLIWYDTRHDPANHLLEVFGTVSTDGGRTFSPNFRVTDQSFDANAGRFTDATGQDDYYLGDFIGLALANNTASAAWTDTRDGNQDIFFAHFPVTPAPAPPNDRFEPNNTPAQATNLGTIVQKTVSRLAIPAGDEDWFRVQAAATGDLTVSALQSDPGRELRLELYDAGGATLLAGGTDVLDSGGNITGQQLVFPGQSGTIYLVHVVHAGPDSGGDAYTMQMQSLTADLGTIVHNTSGGEFISGGQAYYRLAVGATGSLQVQLTTTADLQGTLSLALLDPNLLTVLATGTTAAGAGATAQASLAVRQGQAILVRVSAAAGTHGAFALESTNLDQFATPNNTSLVFPAGAGPSSVAVGDLNGDGIPDLVVADTLANTVSVLLGNGEGTFQAPRAFPVGAFRTPNPLGAELHLPTFRRAVALADLNHDGKLDVVVTNYDSGDVSVLLGRGDGTFEPQRRYDATSAPFDVAVGDLNGDGVPDIVVVSSDQSGTATVAVLLGRGDGTFAPEMTFGVKVPGDIPFNSVRIADFNHDGKADLVLSGTGADKVTLFLGNGDGTFRPGTDFPSSRLGTGLAVADVNGDGQLDIVAAGLDPSSVSVLLGRGDGTFTDLLNPNTGLPGFLASQSPVAVAVADVGSLLTQPDGSVALGPPDGHPDLIVAASGGFISLPPVGPPGVFLLPGLLDGQGQFAGFGPPLLLAAADGPTDVAVADVNGDGVPDVVMVDRNGVRVIFGKRPPIGPLDSPSDPNLGTVVHVLEPTLTIVPGHEETDYTLTVPTEAAHGAGDEVVDFSGDFQATSGAGLRMEVRDAGGNLLGAGERFRVVAHQGQHLTLRVFGVAGTDGNPGTGAYTLDIDTLPQVVSVEAQALLPGQTSAPGGPTASLVLTLQGDRLDPTAAQDPANYTVTWLGPDGLPGTADDQVLHVDATQGVVYDPSTNIDVGSGLTYPTAVRQTVTLLFDQPLPPGSYQIAVAAAVQAAPFNADEAGLLTPAPGFTGHALVSLAQAQVTEGASRLETGLVVAAGPLGSFGAFKAGTPFLSQLHDDLGALLDAQLTSVGDAPSVTARLLAQIQARLDPALGQPGQRPTDVLVLWLDPVPLALTGPGGDSVVYDQQDNTLDNNIQDGYVDVVGNIEVIVLTGPGGQVTLQVSNVPPTARGGVVMLGPDQDQTMGLTDDLRNGTTTFDFSL
jgi:hypothetical protein